MKKPKLLICSAEDALKFVMSHFSDPKTGRPPMTKESYAVISIQDSGKWNFGFTLTENRFCRGVLTLQFDDFEEPEPGVKLMDAEQAAQIIAFLRQYANVDTMLIHCFAGRSRSAAVGRFAADLYNLPAPEYPYYNTWVYGMLHRVHNVIENSHNVQDSEHETCYNE